MRILVYAGNLYIGGSVQVATNFLQSVCERGGGHEWLCVLSTWMEQQEVWKALPNVRFVTLREPWGRLVGVATRGWRVGRLEREFRPDVSFTVFGPPYWKPRVPHVCGMALGLLFHPDSVAWSRFGVLTRWRTRLEYAIKRRCLRDDWRYIVETDEARDVFARAIDAPLNRIHVVSNAPSYHFYRAAETPEAPRAPGKWRFLVLSSYYPHKNLELVPSVAAELKKRTSTPFEFVFTLPSAAWCAIARLGVRAGSSAHLVNRGPTPLPDCPGLYRECDALFLPTLLETFTATYPEAMLMRRPIVTSDLPFARSFCGEAAEYFNPLAAASAADACLRVMGGGDLRLRLVDEGMRLVAKCPTPAQKFDQYMKVLELAAGQTAATEVDASR